MKKIVAAILLFAMALTLFSCGAKPEFVEMKFAKISNIFFTLAADADIDKNAFVDAYNKAEVTDSVDKDEELGKEVIVVTLAGGEDHFTIYYIEDNCFAVTGNVVEKNYYIEAPELAKLYNDIVYPTAEFVSVDEKKVVTAAFTLNMNAEADISAIVKAYNEAEFIGNADVKKTNQVMVLIYENSEAVFEINYLGEDRFRVSGTLIETDFIIESADLAKIYTEAVK